MVSPVKPTHFWNDVPERCSTTTYAWCGALAFTQLPARPADDEPVEDPHAAMTRASVALAQTRCLRTLLPPGGQPFPNAPHKADRQGASVPLRADGSPMWAFRSPGLRIAAPVRLPGVDRPQWRCRTVAPRSQLRDSSGFEPDSLGARKDLSPLRGHHVELDEPRIGPGLAGLPPDGTREHRPLEGEGVVLAILAACVDAGGGDLIDESLVDDASQPGSIEP